MENQGNLNERGEVDETHSWDGKGLHRPEGCEV